MKPNHHKKLELSRETVRHLNTPELLEIHGGKGEPPFTAGNTCGSCVRCITTRDPQEPI